ncbi:alpha/beta fold hydrolase [Pseudactinotalea sp.]|uniref:alpha/beta fold hydrolase n=1 Tax=Pseudactinotalea sp. TaxID=1926260 RepID=UPI003B3B9981
MSAHVSGAVISHVQVQGGSVTVSDSAPGRGDAVVLVPGTGGSTATDYWALFPMLATAHRTVGLDLDPRPPVELTDLVDQVRRAVASLGAGRVHLVGYSLGAVVAAAAAAALGDGLATLTLINGWRRTDRHQRLRNAAWRTVRAESSAAWADLSRVAAHSPLYLRSLTGHQLEELRQRRAARRDPGPEMELNARIDISDRLAAIAVPTLVIASTHDAMVPVHHGRELFGAIAQACYLEIDAGHGVLSERPAEVFAAVADFVDDPTAVPAGTRLPTFQA